MTDAILVLNAGSSSIKFSVFIAKQGEPELSFNGQVEGLYTSPRFVAKTADGPYSAKNPGARERNSAMREPLSISALF